MNRMLLFVLCVTMASTAASAPAEPARQDEVLGLLEASLSAGEGVPAQVLLEQYLLDHPRTPRIRELEALIAFYAGDYESAAATVTELRAGSGTYDSLGTMADLIVDTYETTKEYETVTYENFEVRYAPGPDEILVPYAIDTLKAAAEAMEVELGVKMVSPIRLEIYPDADSLARVSTLSVEAIRNTGTIALCKWGRLMIASPRALMRGYPWLDTIAHEYVHLLITKTTLDRAPVWLQEGLAKLLETRWRLPTTQLPLDPASNRLLLGAAEANQLLDFDQLHPSIALLPSQKDAVLAFAQVSSFMEMFYNEHGRDGVRLGLQHVADAADARTALAAVAGASWKELEAHWKNELAKKPKPPPARLLRRYLSGEATENDELAEVEREKARKHVRLGDLLWTRSRPAAASVEYGKAHRVAPSDPVVASRYARSAIAGGRPRDAIKPLVYTLSLYPTHAPAQSSLATARFRSGDKNGATHAALRAIALNPFDPQPHCVLAELDGRSDAHERELCTRLGGIRE
jgi:Flp pilus assembly protein TadD